MSLARSQEERSRQRRMAVHVLVMAAESNRTIGSVNSYQNRLFVCTRKECRAPAPRAGAAVDRAIPEHLGGAGGQNASCVSSRASTSTSSCCWREPPPHSRARIRPTTTPSATIKASRVDSSSRQFMPRGAGPIDCCERLGPRSRVYHRQRPRNASIDFLNITTKASMGGSSSRKPMPQRPDRSSAASASAGSCASTTGRRPERAAGGSGSIVYHGRLGPLIRFYHRQAA